MKIPICLILLSAPLLPGQATREEKKPPRPPIDELLEHFPRYLQKRCTEERRLAAIKSAGGDEAAEQAVVDALRFLQSTQYKDGSWTRERPVGMTALALLAFLGHGETTESEEFGETVRKGIEGLVGVAVRNRGKMASDFRDNHWTYEHALATYALAEAYLLCERGFREEIPNLRRAVEVAGQFIINSQHKGGGWDYAYSEDSARGGDVSQTTWHLLALRSCKLSGLEFANLTRCSKKGLDYVERMQMASGAMGYSSPAIHGSQDGTTLAALGATSFQIWKSAASKVPRKAVRFIDKEMKFNWNTPDSDLYGMFFAAQTLYRNGGAEWERFQSMVFPQILENQAPGGFFLAPNHGEKKEIKAVNPSFALAIPYGVHYRTCLATLTLETSYRLNFRPETE